jgi:hypothetical protein
MTFLDAVNALTPVSSTLPTSVGVAIFSGYALDLLKRLKSVPKINYYTTKLNTILRVVLSGIGTLGVSWAWSPDGTGHMLQIIVPAWTAVGVGLWHWVVQYGLQHGFEGVLQVQRHLDYAVPNIDNRAALENKAA